MHPFPTKYLKQHYPVLGTEIEEAATRLSTQQYSDTSFANQDKVLKAFGRHKVSADDLWGSTGYGYNDLGREKLEAVFCTVFDTERALVRPNIVSGTHAIWLALSANVKPGQKVLSVTGEPYPTMKSVLAADGPGSFKEIGIEFDAVDLTETGDFDYNKIQDWIDADTAVIYVQKSRGYSLRAPLSCGAIDEFTNWLNGCTYRPVVLVDNCYGEFVEILEPSQCGADIIAGSLIKNPGGGLAETGGYIAGRADLVANAEQKLLAPGLTDMGATGTMLRSIFQGFFLAPHWVGQALTVARYGAIMGELLSYEVYPQWKASRHDIVQTLVLNDRNLMSRFCSTIQSRSPIDSFVTPTEGLIPGYNSPVLMAAGSFIQGASLELSADGPACPPYIVYVQGSLGIEHGLLALTEAFAALKQ
ncbi:MAG: hypothetical protein FH749_03470 [Firmicutes bacterium]|nr:hypothetical protein [Bacillota bacterium]